MQRIINFTAFLFLFTVSPLLTANTSIIVTAGASADGSVMVSYSRDSNLNGGYMAFSPGEQNAPGTVETLRSNWEEKQVTAEVDLSGINYRITGHMNEKQLVIGDSSFTPMLGDAAFFYDGKMDTGLLTTLTLKKAATAREAIKLIGSLTEEYGFYGPGKSFSIADKEEAWIMEMISKGPRGTGSVWVAMRIPDGYVSGHADSSRITTFPLDDSENCLYSEDVITFARKNGLWDGDDKDFSFADVYTVMNKTDIRQSEGRLWNIFRKVNVDAGDWKDYISGDVKRHFPARGTANGVISNRLPLWFKADAPLTSSDLMDLMRDHFEDTDMNMAKGIWAGAFSYPYRLRPDNGTAREYYYSHDRPVSVQYTGYSFISQSRRNIPDSIGGINWFGVDDTYMTVYLPVYSGVSSVPSCLREENNHPTEVSDNSAYWLFNMVSNFSALRYKAMIIDIRKVQRELEDLFKDRQKMMEEEAERMVGEENSDIADFLTARSEEMGNIMMNRWLELFHFLLIKHKDGEMRTEHNGVFDTVARGMASSVLNFYGYPADWAQAMIDKDNPPDLKAIYSDDELMEMFAKNNRRSIVVIALLAVIAVLTSALIVLITKTRNN
ncbi:C69 family dipeptidase [Spirochaeta isovalerica]|uniref:Dipeptidase n=1 Tax=Spirochaeta isovalerica TaxID=150 RepID=A0A841RCB4_9SPIO|nr:C69 family dipeptidase [Spirochaeta isovalerica]MBB6480519.1 dipeptidase [Spirochaeta isovalerica]